MRKKARVVPFTLKNTARESGPAAARWCGEHSADPAVRVGPGPLGCDASWCENVVAYDEAKGAIRVAKTLAEELLASISRGEEETSVGSPFAGALTLVAVLRTADLAVDELRILQPRAAVEVPGEAE